MEEEAKELREAYRLWLQAKRQVIDDLTTILEKEDQVALRRFARLLNEWEGTEDVAAKVRIYAAALTRYKLAATPITL